MSQFLKFGVSTLVLALALPQLAQAGGFAVREQSAEAQGDSFAGVAAGTDGLSAMFWNPATMALHNGHGYMSESNAALILPNSHATDGRTSSGGAITPLSDSGNIGQTAIVPSSYSVYELNDRMIIGMAINSPFGLTTDAKDTWIGVANGDRSDLKTYNFNPQIAYRVSDELSFGLGAQVEYITANLTSRAPGSGALAANITAEDIGYGFTAGLLFQPSDQTSIGLGFRSSISHSLSGPSTIMFKTLPFAGIATANIDTPEIVTLGLRQKLSDQFTMLGGVEWTNWSRFQNLSVQVSSPATTITTVENWKSGWDFSLGGEYAASDNLLLRAGVAYEISPVPDATRTPRIPDNDRLWASVGASYKLNDKMTANLAYSHVFMKDGTTALTGAPLPLFSTFQQNLDIVSAGLTIDW